MCQSKLKIIKIEKMKENILTNELDLIKKYSVKIIPYVTTWDKKI